MNEKDTVFQQQFHLACELGNAMAVEKFASEIQDAKLQAKVLRLKTPVHDAMLQLMRTYGG